MTGEVIERLLLALAIAGGGLTLYLLANHLILARAGQAFKRLAGAHSERPVILYFTTPECAPCKTIQRPALQRVQELLGEQLQVIEVDATRQPELASQWGVLSVPTTFVLDASGRPQFVNHGATRAEKLLEQLQRLGL